MAKLLTAPSGPRRPPGSCQPPPIVGYDVVVVGAGSAGCVLAGRARTSGAGAVVGGPGAVVDARGAVYLTTIAVAERIAGWLAEACVRPAR